MVGGGGDMGAWQAQRCLNLAWTLISTNLHLLVVAGQLCVLYVHPQSLVAFLMYTLKYFVGQVELTSFLLCACKMRLKWPQQWCYSSSLVVMAAER